MEDKLKNVIVTKDFKLNKDFNLSIGVSFKAGQEFTIVNDVVYLNGHMIPPDQQNYFYSWITNSPKLFDDVTRKW